METADAAANPDADIADNHLVWGDQLQTQGKLDEAVVHYRHALALQPNLPSAYNNLGSALARQGRLDAAIECFQEGLAFRPDCLNMRINLGSALHEQGNFNEAMACFREALDLDSRIPELHNNLGNTYGCLGQLDKAVVHYSRAIDLRPEYPDAHYNLGNAFRRMQLLDAAIACYRTAASLRPNTPETYNNLGVVLQQRGRLDEAIGSYRHAVALSPNLPEAHNNLGTALREQGHLDQAVSSFRTAIALRHHYPDVRNNLAMALLAQGELQQGWSEFEWRWETPQLIRSRRNFTEPLWRGEPAEGQTLLIHAEQGFGDTLQFCRYVPLVAERGLRVTLEVQRPLVRLLKALPGIDLLVGYGEQLPPFDYQCPMLSLPLAFQTTTATIPGTTPYLQPADALVASWGSRLDALIGNGALRVGLVWAGRIRPWQSGVVDINRRRNIGLVRLAPLAAVPGVRFVSLQKGEAVSDAETLRDQFHMVDPMAEVQDFADTAAIIANLDVVIGVDTSVVHLAAAMGKTVFLLDRFDHCWRWLVGREDCPWYPSLRIFRQPRSGDWDTVVARAAAALAAMVVHSTDWAPAA